VVAQRTGIPQVVIGLLTAGAEWEEVSHKRQLRFPTPLTIYEACCCCRLAGSSPVISRCWEYRRRDDLKHPRCLFYRSFVPQGQWPGHI
jgi:hypothetical protein